MVAQGEEIKKPGGGLPWPAILNHKRAKPQPKWSAGLQPASRVRWPKADCKSALRRFWKIFVASGLNPALQFGASRGTVGQILFGGEYKMSRLHEVNAAAHAVARKLSRHATLKVLVVDIGGSHVKILATGEAEHRQFVSGRRLTPKQMVAAVRKLAGDWQYDVVSMGFPGPVRRDRPLREPWNLGRGWTDFKFERAFGCPVKIVNDAAMQALGSYQGGAMLFLGLGTGLGSAMIVDGVLEPMELAHLLYKKGRTYEDYLGLRGIERLGKKKWRKHVAKVVKKLKIALEADYVVLGGGNTKKLERIPPGARLGSNGNAFLGGFRLWEKDSSTCRPFRPTYRRRSARPRISEKADHPSGSSSPLFGLARSTGDQKGPDGALPAQTLPTREYA